LKNIFEGWDEFSCCFC